MVLVGVGVDVSVMPFVVLMTLVAMVLVAAVFFVVDVSVVVFVAVDFFGSDGVFDVAAVPVEICVVDLAGNVEVDDVSAADVAVKRLLFFQHRHHQHRRVVCAHFLSFCFV